MPNLSRFIADHADEILAEWDAFARELTSTSPFAIPARRDHAGAMLTLIVRELETPQTDDAHSILGVVDDATSAASDLGEAESPVCVDHMLAEFRALRTSVVRSWRRVHAEANPFELEELTRFHEAIDQAITESMARYSRPAEIGDLLDVAPTSRPSGISVRLARMDMGDLVRDVVSEVIAANPSRRIEVETRGALSGSWDRARLGQALTDLVGNAVEHGLPDAPIKVAVVGEASVVVTLSVNEGRRDGRHVGLGSRIVDQIVEAHRGSIDIRSSERDGTSFVVSLPRQRLRAISVRD